MFRSLRKKLILLFTIATSFILTAVFAAVLYFTEKQYEGNNMNNFQIHVQTITSNLQNTSSVSYQWLSTIESENQLILHIEDNNITLSYPGSCGYATNRNLLIDRLKSLALEENIDINTTPISSTQLRSSIFTMKGNANDSYLGIAVNFQKKIGHRSFILIQDLTLLNQTIQNQRILFLSCYLAGIIGLLLVSRKLVNLSLAPVTESYKKQIEFIAAASHELRSPLTVIRANNTAMRMEKEHDTPFTLGIELECLRMSRLIEDMLTLASADSYSWSIKKEPVDIDFLLISSFERFQPYCSQKKISISFDLPETTLPPIMGDLQRLQQVLSALIDNAISYSTPGSIIMLRSYANKNYLFIEVEDHGQGIPDEQKPIVFDRFYRIDKSRKDKNHFGLGLSIVKELVNLHDGSIELKDTPGGGITFIVRLPI